jgi:hypothetical protein
MNVARGPGTVPSARFDQKRSPWHLLSNCNRSAENISQCGEHTSLIESAFGAKNVRGPAKNLGMRFALANKKTARPFV